MTQPAETDSIGINCASKTIRDNGGQYTLIAVGVRGNNYHAEWGGNARLGASGEHAGFAMGRDQVLDYLRAYIAETGITGRVKLWISVVVAMFGLYLLCMSGSLQLQKGDLLMLLCALAFSGHIMVIDHFSPKVDGVQMSCIQFFVASLFSMVCMLGAEGVPAAGDVFQSWAPILYAGILSSGVGYTLQIVGQKGVNPTIASLILSLESVMSVLAGWLFLHQGMSGREILGCVLMFVAIILAQLPERKKAEKQTA